MKILIVFGTRPEAIKMAPVINAFKKRSDVKTEVCVTAQHREMLDQVLDLFEIVPDYDADIMKPNQDLCMITNKVMSYMYNLISKTKPDYVLVHGDTTTTFATSLAAFYNKTPVVHVEAGLRTWDISSPFPEEANRQCVGIFSDLHFAPTRQAEQNLLAQNIPSDKIFVTGNTVVDSLFHIEDKLKNDRKYSLDLDEKYKSMVSEKNILVTCHRRENFGKGVKNVCLAIKNIAKSRPDASIIFPVHLNPNVYDAVHANLKNISNVHLIEPVEYIDLVYLMSKSNLIITDSGGIQEEAVSLGKSVIVTRETTERPEALDSPFFKLTGTNADKIISETTKLLDIDKIAFQDFLPFGDGNAATRICDIIVDNYYIGCNDDEQKLSVVNL